MVSIALKFFLRPGQSQKKLEIKSKIMNYAQCFGLYRKKSRMSRIEGGGVEERIKRFYFQCPGEILHNLRFVISEFRIITESLSAYLYTAGGGMISQKRRQV